MADILAISTVAGALGALAVTKIRQNLQHRRASWTDDERIHEIRSLFCGEVITPASPEYEREKTVLNGHPSNAPSIIFLPVGTTDVQRAIVFCREFEKLNPELPKTVIRGGGFSYGGLTASNGGCVIDLKHMRSVYVENESMTCWVEGGATAKDVDMAVEAHGFCAVTGPFSHLGVGGFACGGGYGLLTYKYGLLMDSLLEAEVVLASGQIKRCSETENPDLFWGLRGGGRWLACVTRFRFRLYPKPEPEVVSAIMPFPIQAWEKVLRSCDKRQSEAFNYSFAIVSHPVLVGVTACLVHGVFFQGMDSAKQMFHEMIDEIGEHPLNAESPDKILRQISWPKANRALDHMISWGTPMYTQNFNCAGDSRLDDVIHFLDIAIRKKPSHILITLDHLAGPGFLNESGRDKTMWTNRKPFFCGVFLCALSSESHDQSLEASRLFVKAVMDKTAEVRIPPQTINSEEYASVAQIYGDDTAHQFAQVKTKYDPEGFFSSQNRV